jgi:NTE family protein
MVKIGTDHYWDGGIVSNTPLQHLLEEEDNLNTMVFQVDLFSARGVLPRDIEDVMGRHKDIMYSSRTRYNTDVFRRLHNLKVSLYRALIRIPEESRSDHEREQITELSKLADIAILHIIISRKPMKGTPRTMSSPARRCVNIGRAVTKIPSARSSTRSGSRCHRRARASSCTTSTAKKTDAAIVANRPAAF